MECVIRPENAYSEYKRLLESDIKKFFSKTSKLKEIACPGCSSEKTELSFSKMGFDYRSCGRCGSLFVSPRPTDDALRSFYRDSDAGIFLQKQMLATTLEKRSEKVISYRIQWILGLMEEYLPGAKTIVDYATRYPIFLEQLQAATRCAVTSVYPEFAAGTEPAGQSFTVAETGTTPEGGADIVAAFDILERTFDPGEVIAYASKACRKRGLFAVITTTASGFEYQVLGKNSPNLIPPDRINLLSLEALTRRIEESGFDIIEVSTPGRLDVEMVKKAFDRDPAIPLDPFWKYLFSRRDDAALNSLQEYLQQFRLSSHVRIAAIRK